MKRFAIAGSALLITFGLAFFAVAVAQRDSRDRETILEVADPDYANQNPEPIALSLVSDYPSLSNDYPSLVNDHPGLAGIEPIMHVMAETEMIAPLAQATLESSFPQDRSNYESIDTSDLVLAGANETKPTETPTLAAPPGLLAAPSIGAYPSNDGPTLAAPSLSGGPTTPTTTAPPATLNKPMPVSDAGGSLARAPSHPVPGLMKIEPEALAENAGIANNVGARESASALGARDSASASGSRDSASASGSRRDSFSSADPAPLVDHPSKATGHPPLTTSFSTTSRTSLVSPAPGARQIDGAQNPSLQIQKRAPEEVQVGQPATFGLVVRNIGNATAYEVVVIDSVPRGARLSKTNPPAECMADGTLVWSLGEMAAGSEQVLTVDLIPETEGEIGSVASVKFAAQASVRTVSTQPKLLIQQSADRQVLLGKPLHIHVTVTNQGTGVAKGVSLEEDVPAGLRHPLGSTLGVPLGDLVPGQSSTMKLELIGTEAGQVKNLIRAVAANTSTAESIANIEVVAPKLQLSAAGPKLRYLERQATYQISLTNQGTSTAHMVEILAYLPRGLQYNSAGNHGEYLADQHAVSWGLEELAVGATATTELTLLPVEEGDFAIRMQSQAEGVRAEPFEKQVRIEGQSELAFTIEDDNDPIEVNGQTTYAIRLTNTGTRVDEDVQLMIELPPGSRIIQVNGPVGYKATAQGLLFDPIAAMRAKDQQLFRLSVQLSHEGVQVVRAHVKSKLRPVAVVKEESTQVYQDQ